MNKLRPPRIPLLTIHISHFSTKPRIHPPSRWTPTQTSLLLTTLSPYTPSDYQPHFIDPWTKWSYEEIDTISRKQTKHLTTEIQSVLEDLSKKLNKPRTEIIRKWRVLTTVRDNQIKRGRFSAEESGLVVKGVEEFGKGAWGLISMKYLPDRFPEQIRKHYENVVVVREFGRGRGEEVEEGKRGKSWDLNNDYALVKGVLMYGFRWEMVSKNCFTGVRNHLEVMRRFTQIFVYHGIKDKETYEKLKRVFMDRVSEGVVEGMFEEDRVAKRLVMGLFVKYVLRDDVTWRELASMIQKPELEEVLFSTVLRNYSTREHETINNVIDEVIRQWRGYESIWEIFASKYGEYVDKLPSKRDWDKDEVMGVLKGIAKEYPRLFADDIKQDTIITRNDKYLGAATESWESEVRNSTILNEIKRKQIWNDESIKKAGETEKWNWRSIESKHGSSFRTLDAKTRKCIWKFVYLLELKLV